MRQNPHPRAAAPGPLRSFAVIAMILTACQDSSSPDSPESAATGSSGALSTDVIVQPEWLRERLEDPELLLIDARSHEEYAQGHIKGALSLPVDDTYDSDPANGKNLAPTPVIQSVLGEAGIDLDRPLVVYARGTNYRTEARAFWVMEVHGHRRAAVLNGGFQMWMERGFETETEPTELPETRFVARLNPARLATKLTVMQAIDDPDTMILDVREEAEFLGLESKARRAGHIPSAVNIPVSRAMKDVGDTCLLLDESSLAALYDNVDASKKIIIYCNGGKRATASYLTLRSLGYDVSVYDGSWLEWGNDENLPIVGAAGHRN